MTTPTQTPGMTPAARTAPEPQKLNAGAVRKPTIDCPECDGSGVTYGYGTNDPGEKLKEGDCGLCGGIGEVPEPCGPNCPCWIPGEGDTGSCSQDDPEEYTFNRGGLSLWREGEL